MRKDGSMRLIYKHQHEGIWFSHRGHAAYERGEKPEFMWPEGSEIEQTEIHHIAKAPQYKRKLVMFFREKRKNNVIHMHAGWPMADVGPGPHIGVPNK